jgi:nitrogen regulatory protein P-II 2
VENIARVAKTGGIGDGKILALAVDRVMRIRTGETDVAVL